MIFKDNFSSRNVDDSIVFRQSKVPVFQNKVYPSQEEALKAETGEVLLLQSSISGFIYNAEFDPEKMIYDKNYQNEQANSSVFKNHLKQVLTQLNTFGLAGKKIVEIGCGKGVFFDMMLAQGLDCWGYDPTYEGTNPRIIKEYFSSEYSGIEADIIILRHTMEHISNPFTFLHTIAKANNYRGKIFIEVPTFNWIESKKAFWDIFYEHCNYFTEESFAAMFEEAETGNFFGGQYMYLWADLSMIRSSIPGNSGGRKITELVFQSKVDYYKSLIKNNGSFAIWGAGAKGSTFLNLLDRNRNYVKYVVDINPAKQEKYIAVTGHPIHSPSIIDKQLVENVLVMNENYLDEISEMVKNKGIKRHSL